MQSFLLSHLSQALSWVTAAGDATQQKSVEITDAHEVVENEWNDYFDGCGTENWYYAHGGN